MRTQTRLFYEIITKNMLKYLKFLLGSIGFSTVQNKKHAHSRKLYLS